MKVWIDKAFKNQKGEVTQIINPVEKSINTVKSVEEEKSKQEQRDSV